MNRKKLTVYDYLKSKGKRQLSVLFVHNAEEAETAEVAGIDMNRENIVHLQKKKFKNTVTLCNSLLI